MFLKTLSIRSKQKLTKTLLIMKLTAILILTACLQVSAKGYSQKVTLSMRDAPLEKVFKEIQRQTNYNFLFTYELLEKAGKVNVKLQNASLEDALQQCLQKTELAFSIVNKTIVIKEKMVVKTENPVLEEVTALMKIFGRVTDENGRPLEGVSVLIKGSSLGTNTHADGQFNIDIPDNSSKILVFSFVGMETQEVNVTNKNNLSIQLKVSVSGLNEVTVVGYGTQKKVNLTGSVVTLKAAQIENRGVANISNILAGQAPGVTVFQRGGSPGRDAGSLNI